MAAASPDALGARSAGELLRQGAGAPAGGKKQPARPLQDQLQDAGLPVVGPCGPLTAYGEDLLRASPLLQDMTPAEADILGGAMLLVRVEPGHVLIREGDAGDWMMLLLKGTVDVGKRVELKNEELGTDAKPEIVNSRVAVIQRGAAVGEMSMLDNEPRYSSCTAIEAVEAGVLGRHEIALLIRDHPGVGAKLLVKITQLMAQRLRNTSNQLVKLLRKS
ncbi:MAG: Crp/Fnr family transcriptional regulator [Pseudomonadota bacterium]